MCEPGSERWVPARDYGAFSGPFLVLHASYMGVLGTYALVP